MSLRTWPVVAACLVAAVLTIMALPGCQKAPPAIAKGKDPEVDFERPIAQNVTDHEDFTGHLEAIPTVELRAQVTGYLKSAHFKEGSDVHKGDLLFEIDSTVYDAELARAKALVTQAEARYDRLSNDFDRVMRVRDKGTVTQEEIDRIRGDRAEAFAALGVAKAGQAIAQQNVEFTKITAPITGRIGRRMIDPNNLVKANDTPLARIDSIDPIYATFDIDEHTVLRLRDLIREGKVPSARTNATKVMIALADEGPEGLKKPRDLVGIIDFSDPRFESGTGTLRVRAKLNNVPLTVSPQMQLALGWASGFIGGYNLKAHLSPGMLLSPGMFARIRLPIGNPRPGLLVREEALGSDQGQRFVYVLNDKDEVVYRAVKLGPQSGRLRVIEDGLTPSDRVIVRGMQRVKPNVKVTPKPAEPLAETSS